MTGKEINRNMKRRNEFIAFSTGVLLALTYPPFKSGFIAYIGLIPLFYLMESERGRRGFRLGYLWGLGFNLAMLYWIIWATIPGGVAAVLFLPLYSAVLFYIIFYSYKKIGRKSLYIFPFFWTASEYLRSQGVLGFPWTSIAYTQTYYAPLIQYASITSAYGVSFWVCYLNVLFYFFFQNLHNTEKIIKYVIVIILVFTIPFIYGMLVIGKGEFLNENRKIKVSMIQANIDPDVKWDEKFKNSNFSTYEKLTFRAAKEKPDIIIWPETAATCYLRLPQAVKYRRWVESIVNKTETPLITGTLDYKYVPEINEYRAFNSAVYFEPGKRNFEDYAKIKLVPFGERVPFEEYLKFLKDIDMGQGDFYPGNEEKVFILPLKNAPRDNILFSVVICFESIFPDLFRKFCYNGAEFAIVITNDCWFGKTSAPFQHAQISIFRAIENRIGIARNANTGVSMIIDPYGRVNISTPIFKQRIITGKVYLRNNITFYTKYGDVFSYCVIMVSAMALIEIVFIVEMKKNKNEINL